MRVRWTPRARDGFRAETRSIAKDSPVAARHVAAQVRMATEYLAVHPRLGRDGRVIDTRELVVPNTPFTVAYRVREQYVEIVGVVHQAKRWPERFD